MRGTACILVNREVLSPSGEMSAIEDTCSGVVIPLCAVTLHLVASFSFGVAFSPFFDHGLADLVELDLPWVHTVQALLIAVASILTLFLYGKQEEGTLETGEVSLLTAATDAVWVLWCAVAATQVFHLFKKSRTQRTRSPRGGDVEIPTLNIIRRAEDANEAVERGWGGEGVGEATNANSILSGEGAAMGPGMY